MQRIGTIKANVFNKTNKDGKEYTQVAFAKADKQLDGTYKETTMFLFPSDVAAAIAVLTATLPQLTYIEPKNNNSHTAGYQPSNSQQSVQQTEQSRNANFDDDIPF